MGTYIKDVVFVAGKAAYYFDDQAAIKRGASQNGFIYSGQTHTVGFDSVRQPGESISILLILSSDQVAKGDCVAVQYSGAGGRDLLFTSNYFIPFLEEHIKPLLPAPKGFGHPRTVDLREVLNAIFYVQRSGCQWA